MTETLITDQHSDTASYKILRRLGKGGMAEVFLARQEGLAGFRRLTVIKKLLPQFSEADDVAEMLLDEARIAAQLTHPNIVQIYELGKDNGSYFIAMEYVDGCDLATLARIERHRESRIPLRLVLRVVSEAAMGLDYAHRQVGFDGHPLNIVHRDVSPHNIMCSREGAVKVTDFGIAKAVGKALVTQVGVIKGKVQYMSPEQYASGDVDHRSDIFSLGVVLYQLTTGKLPRVAKDGNINMRRVIEGKIPLPSEIRTDYPEELESIVMRALAQNREERYADAASLREDLLDFARDNDLLAFPKELGEYVNAMVPPTSLVMREQSMVSTGPSPKPAAHQIAPQIAPQIASDPSASISDPEAGFDPTVREEQEESDTEAPPGTEVASPSGARRRGLSNVAASQPEKSPNRDADGDSASPSVAMLSNKQLTPMTHESSTQPTDRSQAQSAHTQSVMANKTSPMIWLSVIALLIAVVSVAVLITMLTTRQPSSAVGVPARMDSSLPSAGVIDVLSNPSRAVVAVDGARRCPSTPCQIDALPINRELLLTVRAPGHSLWMQRIVLTHTAPKLLLRADLTPLSTARPARPAPAGSATTGSPDATKKLSAKKQPRKPPQRASTDTSKGQIVTIDIESDQSLLAVDARPWAEVWVDGQKKGHTPIQIALVPGKRSIELKNPDLKFSKTYRISAEKGKKIKISETIPPAPDKGDVTKP